MRIQIPGGSGYLEVDIPEASTSSSGVMSSTDKSTLNGLVNNNSPIVRADLQAGADWGAKVAAAIATLPATGGCVDARALTGAQSAASTITVDRPVKILWGATQLTTTAATLFSITAGSSKAANFSIEGYDPKASSITSAANGTIFALSGDFFDFVGNGKAYFAVQNMSLVGGTGTSVCFSAPDYPTVNFQNGCIFFEHCCITGFGSTAISVGQSVYFARMWDNEFIDNNGAIFIGANAEAFIAENFIQQAANSTNASITLDSLMTRVVHNYLYRHSIADTSTAPHILIRPRSGIANSGGFEKIIDNRFGSEHNNLDPGFYCVQVQSPASEDPTHSLVGGPCFCRGNDFLNGSALGTISASGSTTATLTLNAGYTTHGLQIGNTLVIQNADSAQGFNGKLAIASVVDTSNLTVTLPVAVTGSSTCTVYSGQSRAIRFDNPTEQWDIQGNFFNNWYYHVSDNQTLTTGFNYGQSIYGQNRVQQTYPGYQIFENEGRLFTIVAPNLDAMELPVDGNARDNEVISGLINRARQTEALGSWTKANGIGVTTGQTDSFGTTRAYLLALSGAAPSSQHISNTVDLTGFTAGNRLYVTFLAKAGSCSTLEVGIYDSTASSWNGNLFKFNLSSQWKRYVFWTNGITPTTDTWIMAFYPGDTTYLNGSCYVACPQVSDHKCDYIPNNGNSTPAQDTTAGNRFELSLVCASPIKTQTHDGSTGTAPALSGATGLGTGTAALEAGSTDFAGTILLSPTGSPGSSGQVVVTFSKAAAGNPPIPTPALQDGTGTWGSGSGVRVANGPTTAAFTLKWDNNGAALAAGSTYRLSYVVIARS